MPLFYFEGETENLKLKADYLDGWDLSYLKFCCKVQGIRNELFASDQVAVISLTDIKSYFPPGIEFEDYWPNKVVDSQLLITKNGANGGAGLNNGAHWTRQPTQPPMKPVSAVAAVPKAPLNAAMGAHAVYGAAHQMQGNQMGAVANNIAQQRTKQSSASMSNNLVYNNHSAVPAVANGARSGVNVPMLPSNGRNTNQMDAARMLSSAWSNLSPQEQYQLRLAETNAYASNTLQSFNYNMLRAMQNGTGAGSGPAAPPPLVRGTGNQTANGRSSNGQHM